MNDFSDNEYGASSSTTQGQNSDDNRLTAEVYDEFFDALDLLYIKANLSGRLKFLENWPDAAKYLFGDELIGFDYEGTRDIERRSVLEAEAEERRLALLELVETLEKRSVEKSVLQVEYVESVVKKIGRELSLLLYAPKIVDRFLPDTGAAAAVVAAEETAAVKPARSDIPDPFAEVAPLKPIIPDIDDRLDAVQPISLDQPPPPQPQPETSSPSQTAEKHAPALASEPNIPTPKDVPVDEPVDVPASFPVDPSVAPLKDAPIAEPKIAEPQPSTEAPAPVQAPPLDSYIQPIAENPSEQHSSQATPLPVQPEALSQKPGSPAPSDPTVQDSTKPAMHKALDGQEAVASQKMTFMPAKRPEEKAKLNSGVVPVVGGSAEKSDDTPES